GRSSGLDVVLNHPSISRNHAEVFHGPKGWVVRDLSSANGTLVNGVRVTDDRSLQPQDVLHFGQVAVRVIEMEGESVTPPPEPSQHLKTTGNILLRVEASSRRTWEGALGSLASSDSSDRLPQGKHFLTLLRAGYHL